MSPSSGQSIEDVPDLGPVPQRLSIDVEAVCHLVAEQSPRWSQRPITPAVIDFGTCRVCDPSCDLAIAWTLLTRPGRQLLRERLDIEESSWARGRGWAL